MTVNIKKLGTENKAGLTIGDLRAFVVALDGAEEMPDDALLMGRVSMGGKLRRLEVDNTKRRQSAPLRSEYTDFPEPS